MTRVKERWGTRIGLILAAAGGAIGIGNLLRFPSQAAQFGGGAFMIPYVVSLLLFGLPIMWIAWTIGRRGGSFGHTSLPGMFDKLWNRPVSKYFGVLGLALPFIFCLYYTYIGAWCLSYSYFSLTGQYLSTPERAVDLNVFYNEFLGRATSNSYFSGVSTALVFLIITIVLNIWILARGVAKGIEQLAKVAIPLLLFFCVLLAARVATLGTVKGNVLDGLAFLWTPDFSALTDANVWIAAAGQIFFTLSIGFGSLECYASYVRKKEDIALAGLTTTSTNEFVEIIFGSMIAIPAAAVFFGSAQIAQIAQGDPYAIGMISMPEVLRSIPGVQFFGTIWFLLLFFAAFTSSVSTCQPVMAFLQDEAKLTKGVAAAVVGLVWFLGTLPIIYFFKYGFLSELDYWAGTVGLCVLALIEVVFFSWIFGIKRGWNELHEGALIRVPGFFKFIMTYVTPFALLAILIGWMAQANLTPSPNIIWNVMERSKYPGDFTSQQPAEESASAKQLEEIQNKIYQTIDSQKRDMSVWAEVDLLADGRIEVVNFNADPGLRNVLDKEQFHSWLSLQDYKYELSGYNNQQLEETTRITIALEVLYRAPFIWLARALMIGFFVAFLVMIGIIWKGKTNKKEQEAVA